MRGEGRGLRRGAGGRPGLGDRRRRSRVVSRCVRAGSRLCLAAAPAVLRAAAVSEAKKLKGRMVELRNLLAAPLRPEYSDEYRAETLGRLRRLMVNSAAEQIGCADAAE